MIRRIFKSSGFQLVLSDIWRGVVDGDMRSVAVAVVPVLFAAMVSCGSPSHVGEALSTAEAVMEERPDSALSVLSSVDSRELRSDADRALYALLLTQAQMKNYVAIPSDSLIESAVRYFDDGSDQRRCMLANFYLADVNYENKNYSKSIISVLKAYEIALELDDKFWIAMCARTISDIYFENHCRPEGLEFAKIALDNFRKTDRHIFTCYAVLDLAREYHSNENYDECIKLTKQIVDSALKYEHSDMLVSANRRLGISYLAKGDYETAKHYYELLCKSSDAIVIDSIELGICYVKTNEIDKAKSLKSSINFAPALQNNWFNHSLYAAQDSLVKAHDMVIAMNSDLDSALRYMYQKNLVGALLDFNDYKSRLHDAEIRNSRIIIIFVSIISLLVVSIIVYFTIRHHKRQKTAIEYNVGIAENLREIIAKNDMHSRTVINEILSKRFEEIDKLCNKFFENQSAHSKKELSKEVEKFIYSYSRDKEKIAELEDYANRYYDNVISNLRRDFPTMIESDILFVLYARLGFSNTAIALLMHDDKLTAVYDRRKRIKAKFKSFEGDSKSIYLDAIS